MAVVLGEASIMSFEDWYTTRGENARTGLLDRPALSPAAAQLELMHRDYRREMDSRVANYYKLEMLADNEVVSPKPDLPNISSGETAGIVRRIARNLVQHTPNVDVVSVHDDESPLGIFSRHILTTKIIGDDLYSNDMQQNLFASTKTAFTLGFACVLPVLLQHADGSWYMKYDVIHHRDVYPEPGAKDVREASSVFIRRYLTRGELKQLIRDQVEGWDVAALRTLASVPPQNRDPVSASSEDRKHHTIPQGYEIITWYSNTGEPFLTFCPRTKLLLRIEKNNHPLKWHPVHFLVLEKDDLQPLGRSQVELLLGRQEFQDLMLNGAMKLWYRNINPSIIGYGTVNSIPNLSPGKYTQIANPNARLETFEVNTQTLLQYGQISQQNLGSMVQLVGAADQQMATQSGGNNGMSATPQGVDAQTQMVDITTNNYQKAIESFFSHYCSYALTLYFHELSGKQTVRPSADARKRLLNAGLPIEQFDSDGSLEMDFDRLATMYYVRCVPGSLVEMEDEKQLRILNELLIPLSQALPALANAGNPEVLANAAATMQFIVQKEIELSGSAHSSELATILKQGQTRPLQEFQERTTILEQTIGASTEEALRGLEAQAAALTRMQEQMEMMAQTQGLLLEKLGVLNPQSTGAEPAPVNAQQTVRA